MDINAALDVLVSKESSGAEKSAALKALNIEKQPGSWLPDEVVTGATAGGLLLGSLLPFFKPIRRLAEKRWEPALYAARKAGGKDFYTGIGDFGLLSEVGGVPLKYDTKVSSAFNEAAARRGGYVKWLNELENNPEMEKLVQESMGKNWNSPREWAKAIINGDIGHFIKAAGLGRKSPPTIEESLSDANAKTLLRLGSYGGIGGTLLGGGIGYSLIPDKKTMLAAGKLNEPTYKALIDVIVNKDSSQEDKAIAYEALRAQGQNTESALSFVGKTALGSSLGMLAGGLAGAKLGKMAAKRLGPNSTYGATADVVYGPGARHDAKFMDSGAADLGESIGDTIGAGVGALIPSFLPNSGMSNSYLSRLDQLRSGDPSAQQDAAAKLLEGYYKTDDNPTWNEAILGAVGGGVGAMAGAAHRVLGRKGLIPGLSLSKKAALGGNLTDNDRNNMFKVMEGATGRTNYRDITRSDVADIMIRGGLGAGYGGSAGTALGLAASGRYADPFDEDR